MINQMVAMKIAELYPDNICLLPVFDENRERYAATVMEMDRTNGIIGKTLYSTDNYIYLTEAAAIIAINQEVEEAMGMIKIMSN
jgi:hypothetical protein